MVTSYTAEPAGDPMGDDEGESLIERRARRLAGTSDAESEVGFDAVSFSPLWIECDEQER